MLGGGEGGGGSLGLGLSGAEFLKNEILHLVL